MSNIKTAVSQVRKAFAAAFTAALGTAYAAAGSSFALGHLSGAQWQAVAAAGLTGWVACFHIPNALAAPIVGEVAADVEHAGASLAADLAPWAEGELSKVTEVAEAATPIATPIAGAAIPAPAVGA